MALVADGGSGPAVALSGGGVISQFAAAITPGEASNAVEVSTATAPPEGALIVGAPELTITYSGTTPDGVQPTRVFAQLVDPETGLVLGNQITPIDVVLDGATHTATVPLEMVAHFMVSGTSLTVQIVASTVAYAVPRLGGSLVFDSIQVSLPVMTSAVANAG
jgi:ABC-2 type transport system ATP-binding protein